MRTSLKNNTPLILAVALAVVLSACGEKPKDDKDSLYRQG